MGDELNFIFYLIVIGFGLLNVAIGIATVKSKTPDYFWSFYEVEAKDLRASKDLKAYNKANGLSWFICAYGFFAFAVIMTVIPSNWINSPVWGGLIFAWIVLSLIFMVRRHKKIYEKYCLKLDTEKGG